jgi:hypothetical protein
VSLGSGFGSSLGPSSDRADILEFAHGAVDCLLPQPDLLAQVIIRESHICYLAKAFLLKSLGAEPSGRKFPNRKFT